MADTSDVQDALAALVANILYPPGAMGAGGWSVAGGWASCGVAWADRLASGTSAAGMPVRICRGWPVAQQLDPDLAAGIAHVTVYEDPGRNRLTGGYLDSRIPVPGAPPTIQASVSGQVVTLSGEATPGNMVGLLQAGQSASYVAQPDDTLLSVAQALAAQFGLGTVVLESGATVTDDAGNPLLLAESVVAAANGSSATITFSNPAPITARVASQGSVIRRGRQQTQGYRLICWAPTPTVRDADCWLVDAEIIRETDIAATARPLHCQRCTD